MTLELQHLKQDLSIIKKPGSTSVPLGKDFLSIPYLKEGIFSSRWLSK